MFIVWARALLLAVASLYAGALTAYASSPVLPSGNEERGKIVYAQCMGCHSPDRHRTGPKHCGLIGRKAGAATGYDYSQAMQESDVVWNEETLDHFLSAPLSFMPGTDMGIAGIKSGDDRRDLIAYLMAINEQQGCD